MRWLITGAAGMVGSDLQHELKGRSEETVAVGRVELDVSDRDAVLSLVRQTRPDVIVNCAAFTRVDDCETNQQQADAINGLAVETLATAANDTDALLVHISTDFVFDGSATTPYDVDHPTAPVSAYGRSKLLGEEAARRARNHVILRTSWLFGIHGWNFVEAMRKQVTAGKNELRVVDDQRGKPTYTPHLAQAIINLSTAAIGDDAHRGVFHYADDDECSWFDFAVEIMRQLDERSELPQKVNVIPVTTADFPRPAQRPPYSVLSTRRYSEVTGQTPESWREGLEEYLELRRA
jgi:dTDP-4-dehydrorhamnose reductase